MIHYFLLAVLCLLTPLASEEDRTEFIDCVESTSRDLFSTLTNVSRGLIYYEKGYCAGIEIDFQKTGVYYTPSQGLNWWQYYFEPIFVGNPNKGTPFPYTERQVYSMTTHIENACTTENLQKVFKKYIRIQPSIKKKVQEFYKDNFKDLPVIGVHYRQGKESITYEEAAREIDLYAKENKLRQFLVFVSTDEQSFLDMMRIRFPTAFFRFQVYAELKTSLLKSNLP